MSLANNLLSVHNNLNSGLTEQSELITQISEALVGKVASSNSTAKPEQEKTINTQAYTDKTVTVEPDDGKTLSKVTVNIDVKEEQEKSIEITENGTQIVLPDTDKSLSKVTITANIEGGGNGNDVDFIELKKTISSYSNNNLSYVDGYAFAGCSSLTSVNLPVCSNVRDYAFAGCSSLTSIDLPMCRNVNPYAFRSCSSLISIDLPMCSNVNSYAFHNCSSLTSVNLPVCSSIGAYAFQSCSFLTSINLPMLEQINGIAVFTGCSSLTSVNLPMCSGIASSAFDKCISLTSLILGYSSVVRLGNINAFNSTPMSVSTSTGTFGSIYVPASLVDAYKSATNWITYADRITAIVE